MLKTNYHTHSVFCDGHDSLETIVKTAVAKGFDILGLSSHAMYPFSSAEHIAPDKYAPYISEITRLSAKYGGKIKLLKGFEVEYIRGVSYPRLSDYRALGADYIIGSVHFVSGDGGFYAADDKRDDAESGIRRYFAGDVKRAAREYFAAEREMLRECAGDFTILGHPDLITKQNITPPALFNEREEWYLEEIRETAKAIAASGVCVEINTGAVARYGARRPYPAPYFLSLLRGAGVPVTISSDAHDAAKLDFWFPEAARYALDAGYTELCYFDGGEPKFQKIAL